MRKARCKLVLPALLVPDPAASIDKSLELRRVATHVGRRSKDNRVCRVEGGRNTVVLPTPILNVFAYDPMKSNVGQSNRINAFGNRFGNLLRMPGGREINNCNRRHSFHFPFEIVNQFAISLYATLFRPLLFRFNAETAHYITVEACRELGQKQACTADARLARFWLFCLMKVGSVRWQEVCAMVRRLVDPNQVDASSEFWDILSPVALRRLQESWQHLFRRAILERLPANASAVHFHDVMGRPTKELYSVASLLLIRLQLWVTPDRRCRA